MNDATEMVLRWVGAAAIVGSLSAITVRERWGTRLQQERKRVRNPYRRYYAKAAYLTWIGALLLSGALVLGNYVEIIAGVVVVALYFGFWQGIIGLGALLIWAERQPQWVRRAIGWTSAALIAWLVIIGLAAGSQEDAPIRNLRDAVAPWKWGS